MSPTGPEEDPFVREVRRQAARAQVDQRMTFWQGLGLVGSVGWMVVVPALVGAFLGRWIDAAGQTKVFWTVSLLFAGLGLGCVAACRHVGQELHR
jgi:ATP synthase protein I